MATIEVLQRLPTPADFAGVMLKEREAAVQLLEDARQAGDRKSARSFEAHVRGMDKLIAKYGLNRYRTIT